MDKIHITWKRAFSYMSGLFVLAFGVSLSILADLGVSPVSSLPYALSLSSGMTVGIATVIAAYLLGKILGWYMKRFKARLELWLADENDDFKDGEDEKEKIAIEKEANV
ncbi:hypothetical protein [Ureibacillus terrenus]|uniref:Uncharacterized protein n=1 Tax=Ureibacillus terrenus TaxID=118246 RepID=A0A540UX65_9BACL|nr:hypothetical protein [Ureibacillus terrenus]MED3662822.1 hypothetical protein [Ureibacillus terrenus]MED3762881.1 hypothetical protein [Ureibacillus terrenus]TQE89037.1 hypothetical protein FKZ59_12940 [Ureibacillus terrenus]